MNSITLQEKDSNVYKVEHNGKYYDCRRVTGLIEETRRTPLQLVRWQVNVGALAVTNHPDLAMLDADEIKKYAWEESRRIADYASGVGTAVHKAIETGIDPMDDDAVTQSLKAYMLFKKNYEPNALVHELRVYDTTNLVAGSIDFVGSIFGSKDIWILDWKTSGQINENYLLQVAIYQQVLTQFIKEYKKNPAGYDLAIQNQMNSLVAALKRGVKLRCGVVRLDKHVPVRETTPAKFEFVALTDKQVKGYQREFKLILKLTKLREGMWERAKQERDTKRHLKAV